MLLGFRALVSRAHGLAPYFVVHGQDIQLPSILSHEEWVLPEEMSVDELVAFGEEFAEWMSGIRK